MPLFDRIGRDMSLQVNARADDLVRMTKLLTSYQGARFLTNQALLRASNFDATKGERKQSAIDNVVDVNIAALEKQDIGPEVMNVALNQPNSVNGLLQALQQIIGTNIEPEFCPPRKGDVRKTHADISRAKEILGWTPQVDFYSGLEKTVNWFKSQQ